MSRSKKVKAYPLFLLTDGTTPAPCDYKGEYQAFGPISEARDHASHGDKPMRFFVLPADATSLNSIVETVAITLHTEANHGTNIWRDLSAAYREPFILRAIAALAAIGITRPSNKEDKA